TVRSVTATGGASASYETSRVGADLEIKIGDPDRTVSGDHTYDIVYSVRAALNGFDDHDELYWNALGTAWTVPIDDVTVAVDVPFGPAADPTSGAGPGPPDQPVPLFEHPSAPVEFEPPDRLRPGQVGTLIDERANPLDATATIVDLAVRGYLGIEEIPQHG